MYRGVRRSTARGTEGTKKLRVVQKSTEGCTLHKDTVWNVDTGVQRSKEVGMGSTRYRWVLNCIKEYLGII